jgi:hypothetical protein
VQPSRPAAPPGPLSPDGNFWWDGVRWLPIAITPAPSMPPAGDPGRTSISWSVVGGAVAILVSAVVLTVACFLPFTYFINPPPGTTAQASIVNEGYGTGFWYSVEPILVIVLAVAAGIVMIAWSNRTARVILAAALAAIGLQTFALFIGYAGGTNIPGGETSGPAGWVGMAGAIVMMAGAIVAGVGALQPRPSH